MENRGKHGVDFDEAMEAIVDDHSRAWPDLGHSIGESRMLVIGHSRRDRMLAVVVALDPEGKMRIISARRATKRERHAYEEL